MLFFEGVLTWKVCHRHRNMSSIAGIVPLRRVITLPNNKIATSDMGSIQPTIKPSCRGLQAVRGYVFLWWRPFLSLSSGQLTFKLKCIPIGSIVVPCCSSYFGSYKVTPKGTTMEPLGIRLGLSCCGLGA